MGSENNTLWNPQEMPMNWTDNDKDNLESATVLLGELAQELPGDIVLGGFEAACGAFYFPAIILGHARRGLRDLRAELKKWESPPEEERPF